LKREILNYYIIHAYLLKRLRKVYWMSLFSHNVTGQSTNGYY